jgi:chitin disaccharide deacetylase
MTLPPNPMLKRLGCAATDRVAIIHTDDIGLSAASVAAAQDLWQARIISSSAVMVPCAWFPLTARLCRATPHIDMGVHLTLTSEWDDYRWGPISTRDPASGLLDSEGFFYRTSRDAQEHADPEAAEREIAAQIERALAAGIDVTHIDTHMGSTIHPKLLGAYVKLGARYKIPAMIPRMDNDAIKARGFDEDQTAFFSAIVARFDDEGVPMIDHVAGMPLEHSTDRLNQVFHALDGLKPGITHFIIHPSHNTPEGRATNPDLAARVGDYETFMDERVRAHIKNAGIRVIGYRELRDAARGI